MENEQTATLEPTGGGSESPSTESLPTTEVAAGSQNGSNTQVESAVNLPQASETQRRKVSDHYKERDRYRRLEETVKTQNQRMEEMSGLLRELRNPKPAVSSEKFDKEKFWNDPEVVLAAREAKNREEVEALKQELGQMRNQSVQSRRESAMREGLELLFPKSSPESNETLEQRIAKDPEYAERVKEILNSPSLSKLSEIDPKGAAELAQLKIQSLKPPQSPKVISKTLMGSTARGNPSGGGGKVTVETKMAELKKLTKEVETNPRLRHDVNHKAQREKLMGEVESLMQEKRA